MLSRINKKKRLMAYLNEEKNSYPQIFENSPDILLFVVDLKGVIVNVRGGSDQISGMNVEEIIGKKYSNFIYEEDLELVKGYFAKVLNGEAQYVKYRVINNGEVIHIDVTLTPIQIENNEVLGFYGLTSNVSVNQELKLDIQEMREKLQSLIHYSHEIIGILDSDGTIVFESPSIEAVLGYKVEEITGKNFFDLLHPDDLHFKKGKFKEILNRPNTPFTAELRLKHNNGEWRDFEVIYTNLLNTPSVNGIICNVHDITEIKKQQREIQYMAYHDYLTELPNRRAFENAVDLEIRLANIDKRKFAVMLLNLDGFKFLNDSLGHEVGDLLLIEIARKIKNTLNKNIKMMARISGDEFAILTTNLQDVQSIEQIAKEALHVFEQSFDIKGYNLFITTSIGISIYPESGDDTASLMKNAGLALYLAEKAGNGKYQIFSPTANVATYKVFSLRNELKQALHDNQFLVYYQPIVHAGTNQVGSVEALLRWNHPVWGIVPPDEFIPLAEESGLIIPIGEWVLRTVCKNVRLWHNAGHFIQASVNLSLVQFLQAGLVDMISSILQENELDPKWLNIEITESTMMEKEEKVLGKIKGLRELGIQISLDDFGTGYASFKSLRDIRPDILKIDRSLIKDIPSDKDSSEIVTSIIQLAQRLSIKVVAEGVETIEQRDFVSDLQCDWIQGYLFSRPVSEENILKLLNGKMNSEIESLPTIEKRKYFRIDLQYPLEAFMTVSEINRKKVQLGSTKVLVKNIGPGGLGFVSNIKLPARSDIVLKFETTIIDKEMTLYGTIVYDEEQENLHRYGVKFIVDEKKRDSLIKHFNQFQLQLKKDPLLKGHSFVTENVTTYFREL
ncbi:EAL domain-containing protein [Sporosarcina sp. BP05]|uniref:EAL domain-containing protein n=1 Tax=Sporosarcina sp. BP05 TaxID=2758726 RepID=UPI001649607D|nr:EAL domain-containing protein [Sporosarcina sp. BP05]